MSFPTPLNTCIHIWVSRGGLLKTDGDQLTMFIVSLVHIRPLTSRASGTDLEPIANRKGLIYMPWMDRIVVGVPVHPTETLITLR